MTQTKKAPTSKGQSLAKQLNGKTRHDRNKAKPAVLTLQQQLDAAKAEVKALQNAKKAEVKAGKSKQVIYLKDGVTGKELTQSAKGLTNATNEQALSLSKVLNLVKVQVNKQGFIMVDGARVATVPLINLFPSAKKADITPANLLPFRTDAQKAKGIEQLAKYGFERFTVAQVRQWAVSFYKAKNGYIKPLGKVVAVKP